MTQCPYCQSQEIVIPDENKPNEKCCEDCAKCWEDKTTRWYSFAVAPYKVALIEYLDSEKAKGRGNLSNIIREALEAQMGQRPPKWFEEWLSENGFKLTPMVQQQQVKEEVGVDLGGLFDD